MMERVASLRSEGDWLETLVSLRLPPTSTLQPMSIPELQMTFRVPHPIATLVADLAAARPKRRPAQTLHCIPEAKACNRGEVLPLSEPPCCSREVLSLEEYVMVHGFPQPGSVSRQRRRRCRARCDTPPVEAQKLALEEVEHVPSCAKQRGYYAGLASARHGHYVRTEVMTVLDGMGTLHRLPLHVAHRLPRPIRRERHEPKWPSQARCQRDRACERVEKALVRGVFTCMDLDN